MVHVETTGVLRLFLEVILKIVNNPSAGGSRASLQLSVSKTSISPVVLKLVPERNGFDDLGNAKGPLASKASQASLYKFLPVKNVYPSDPSCCC